MVTKVFAIGSITALAGLVAIAGCSTTVTTISDGDAGGSKTDSGKKTTSSTSSSSSGGSEDEDGGASSSSSSGSTSSSGGPDCLGAGPFTPEVTKPPAAKVADACTTPILTALAEACAEDPAAAGCETERAKVANTKCAACVFGAKADASWKVIVLDPGGTPPATYNQTGCIEHVTGVAGCGKAYNDIGGCIDTFCGKCEDADFTECNNTVLEDQCKDHALDGDCAKAFQAKKTAISNTCFPKSVTDLQDIKNFFVAMGKAACGG